jgi:hypothetical protein
MDIDMKFFKVDFIMSQVQIIVHYRKQNEKKKKELNPQLVARRRTASSVGALSTEMLMKHASSVASASSVPLAVFRPLRAITNEARSAACSVSAYGYSSSSSLFVSSNRFAELNEASS